MENLTLEQRVEALERAILELKMGPAKPHSNWWETNREPLTPEQLEAFDDMVAYGQYFRKTGKEAPTGWKRGDPIPEPDEEWCPR
ncbi:MAG: hypothetical protein JNK93_11040 [Planctomycetia bacterium]|nr:hypothetical protein [Planctomycetia bacterium]